MRAYDHKKIEGKWQKEWEKSELYKTEESGDKPKCYVLDMFPYPSGDGLHVGHPKGYIATDVYSRMKRMQGFSVLHPMGWDAFGLPAEQYALKNKVHPRIAVEKNVAHFKDQLSHLGFNYDWSREVNTTDPNFYKWTQWIFKQLYKKGLAYESNEPINWCPVDKTGLSNEDLENGKCERCGSMVEKKSIRQWVLKITDYADRMLLDLDALDWPQHIKESQRNWIGKSEGAEIEFAIKGIANIQKVKVFTTRPDTLFGATYLAISTELAQKWIGAGWLKPSSRDGSPDHQNGLGSPSQEVKSFISEIDAEAKERAFDFKEVADKKGIDTGVRAINPANGEEIPVWIANYVLAGYGTGAIMAVPAHDERDNDFAKKYSITIRTTVNPRVEHEDVIGKGERVKKHKVIVLLEHEGKHLSINWKPELGGRLFIGGTIEDGESPRETALREIVEETGYTDFEILEEGDDTFFYDYYAYSKKQAFSAEIKYIRARLLSTTQKPQQLEETEQGNFTVEWVTRDVAEKEITNPPHRHAFTKYVLGTPFTESGVLSGAGQFSGMTSEDAKRAITEYVGGKLTSQYRLKEWVFARQRYWGEPFPVVYDKNRKPHMVADSELPVVLPNVESYEPTDTGESPLANIREWVEVYGYLNADNEFLSCDKSDPRATMFERETNTMPQWAGSSWYYLRYIDPTNAKALVDKDKEKKWSPVDFYVGGAEHATRHLIYARFWHKFLYDIGVVSHPEPFLRLQNVGLIMADDGRKMSKRYGNVVNPDDIVELYGADSLRIYEMFMGPFGQSIAWSTDNLIGARRFIERVWRLQEKVDELAIEDKSTEVLRHQTIKKVGEDIEGFAFNTAISQLMIFLNHLEKMEHVPVSTFKDLLLLIAPFAPHVAEELWRMSHAVDAEADSIHTFSWPVFLDSKCVTDTITIGVQVNGKLRETIEVTTSESAESVKERVVILPTILKWLDGAMPKKVIYVPNKIINIVF
jgi:leucyl-tRNA synthetase